MYGHEQKASAQRVQKGGTLKDLKIPNGIAHRWRGEKGMKMQSDYSTSRKQTLQGVMMASPG